MDVKAFPVKEMKKIKPPSVRRSCDKRFIKYFRAILYNVRLTWGAKCVALAILDLPPTTEPKNSKLARKLKSSPSQISIWRKELKRKRLIVK